MHSLAAITARATMAMWGFTSACTASLRIVCLVMRQHIDIIAIYRRHRYYRAFPGPTATRCCHCSAK